MTNKEILVDGVFDYNLIIDDNRYCLHYSNAEHWHYKGELILGLEDDENGFKMVVPLEKKGRINYAEAECLYILLSAVKESKIEVVEVKKFL
jgi:hypothetical protein